MAVGSAFATIGVSIRALTGRFRAGMAKANASLARFSKAALHARTTAGGLAAMMVGGPVLAALALGVAVFKAASAVEMFSRAMKNSLAIMGDVSTTMRVRMTDAAIEMARVSVFSAEEVARSYFFLASAGLDAARALKALPVVTAFAQAGMFNAARATELLTDAQTALGLKVKDATMNMLNMIEVGDAIVKANTMADQTTEQFAIGLSRAGGMARVFGSSMEDTVAVLAAFADQNLKAEEGGTAFNIVLRDMLRTSGQFPAAWKRFGVEIVDVNDKLRPLVDIYTDMEKKFKKMTGPQIKAQLELLGFQERAVKFTAKLIGMSAKMQLVRQGIIDSGNTMAQVAGNQMTDFQLGWEALSATMLDFVRNFKPAVDLLGRTFGKISDAGRELAEGREYIISADAKGLAGRRLIGGRTKNLTDEEIRQIIGSDPYTPLYGKKKTLGEQLKAAGEKRNQAISNLKRSILLGRRATEKLDIFGTGELAPGQLARKNNLLNVIRDGKLAAEQLNKLKKAGVDVKKAIEEMNNQPGSQMMRNLDEARKAMEGLQKSIGTRLRTAGMNQFGRMADAIMQAAKKGGTALNKQAIKLLKSVGQLQSLSTAAARGSIGRFTSGTSAMLGLSRNDVGAPLMALTGRVQDEQLQQQKLTVAQLKKMVLLLSSGGMAP